ncbi:MAG: hypothetical protein A2101_02445 [Spirochaetes bacterium GWF2_52_7]|nr:MAG: hypothetical protein A2101_02445 [Spirochaetes bacterium GWF2_52_7]
MDSSTVAFFSSIKISLTFRDIKFDPDSDFDSDSDFDLKTSPNSFTVVKATGRLRGQCPRYSFSG